MGKRKKSADEPPAPDRPDGPGAPDGAADAPSAEAAPAAAGPEAAAETAPRPAGPAEWLAEAYSGQAMTGLPTGLADLDEITAGLQPCELVVVAGRPSNGKSDLVLNVVRHVAVEGGRSVLFVALERSRAALVSRLLCCLAGVDDRPLRHGKVGREERARLDDADRALRSAKLAVDAAARRRPTQITAAAREMKERQGLDLIVVDPLNLVRPEVRRDNRHEEVGDVVRELKAVAMELGVPVVVTAEVGRQSQDRMDARPRLADIRESSSVEEIADTVLLLHRPDRYEPGMSEGVAEVIVAKQRGGPTGEVTLAYRKECGRFEGFNAGSPFEM